MIQVNVLTPPLESAYDHFLLKCPGAIFQHTSRYKNFLRRLLGCKEEYLIALDANEICGAMPLMFLESEGRRIYNSLPFFGSNGGFVFQNSTVYVALLDAYNEIARRKNTLSSTIVGNPFADEFIGACYNYLDYRIGLLTDISAMDNHQERIMARIKSTARRNINHALKENIAVTIDHTQTDWLRRVHQDNMRAIGGQEKPEHFFALISDHFRPGQDYDLYVASKDGVTIAGLIIFYFGQTVEYFVPAIEKSWRSMQPLSLLLINAMVDASRRGFKWWNWGGTGLAQTSLYQFKKKWATSETKYKYHIQLNDSSLLDWRQDEIITAFPNFYVLPFSFLNTHGLPTPNAE